MVHTVILLKNKTVPRDPYYELFESKLITSHFLPLLKHSPTDLQLTIEFLISEEFVKNTKYFIITSQRAVEVFNACIDEIKGIRPDVIEQIYEKVGYTVGPATAKILKDNGFNNVRGGSEAGNGSILSDIIIKDFEHIDEKLVFFTGEIRKDIIPQKLVKNSIKFEERVIYKTVNRDDIDDNFNNLKSEMDRQNSWVIFFSPQGTELIVEYILENGGDKKFNIASIGPTTEEYLIAKGIKPKVIAKKPEANSLLESIMNY